MSISGVSCLGFYAICRPASAERTLLLYSQRTHTTLLQSGASPRLHLVQSLRYSSLIHIASNKETSCTGICIEKGKAAPNLLLAASSLCRAQTHSQSSPSCTPQPPTHIFSQARARNNLGSFLILRKGFSAWSACLSNNLRPPFSNSSTHRSSCLPTSSSATMSTLSQPQTPATLDSPLREHRHRPVERLTDRLETPSLDDRSYRVVRLPNQLEVLLVHDAETDKASAAMDVNVGNFSDDEELSGTAHAVEQYICQSKLT
jgi:hypothetical protein